MGKTESRNIRLPDDSPATLVKCCGGLRVISPGFEATAGELQVLSLKTMGYSNKQIAIRLSLGEKTVKNYLTLVWQRNNGHGERWSHHQDISDRAWQMGLTHPLFILGLASILGEKITSWPGRKMSKDTPVYQIFS